MRYLRTNTACRVTVGPFLDKTDGITPKTSLTVTSIKLTFMVDDGNVPTLVLDTNPTASGGSNDMVHVSGDDAGFYDLELAAANVNYLGRAMLALTDASNHCPVFHEFMILPAMIYDAMVLGTDDLDTNTKKWNDLTTVDLPLAPTTAGRKLDVSTGGEAGLDWANIGAPTTTVGLSGTTVKTATDVETDTQDLQSRVPAALTTDGNIKADALRIGGTTQTGRDIGASVLVGDKTGFALTAGEHTAIASDTQTGLTAQGFTSTRAGYLDTLNGLVQAIWDKATSALTVAGSIGKKIVDNLDAAISSRSTYAGADTSGTTTLLSRLSSGRATNLDNLDAAVSTRLATSGYTTPTSSVKKNVAINNFEFVMVDSANVPKTGCTGFTKTESINGASFTAISGAVTEVGNGVYKINLTSGEMNGDVITLRFAASGAQDTLITLVTNS